MVDSHRTQRKHVMNGTNTNINKENMKVEMRKILTEITELKNLVKEMKTL